VGCVGSFVIFFLVGVEFAAVRKTQVVWCFFCVFFLWWFFLEGGDGGMRW